MRALRLSGLVLVLVLAGCGDKSPGTTGQESAPAIGRVEPSRGPTEGGTVAVIRGLNFRTGATVTFGDSAAPFVKVVDATTITAVTPPGAAGSVPVVVANPGGASSTFADGFSYYQRDTSTAPAPTLASIQPNTGPASGGTYALVTGGELQPGALLFIGRSPATEVVVVSNSQLTGRTPVGDVGPADVEVTNPDGQSVKLAAAFAYHDQAGSDPAITGVTPLAGPTAGGTLATVSGSNFRPGGIVLFGGRPAAVMNVTAGAVSSVTPASPPGVADVVVTNPDGRSGVSRGAFNFYVGGPVVTRVVPNFGPPDGGTNIVIEGRNLQDRVVASIGGRAVGGLQRIDERTLQGISPPGPVGPADVTVLNFDGQSDTLVNGWAWGNAPPPMFSLVRATPEVGPIAGGTRITLIGSGFTSAATVTIGGAPATGLQLLGGATLSVTTPPGAVGPAPIVVTQGGMTATLPLGFWYFDPSRMGPTPQLTRVTPALGPAAGGSTVLVTGSGFATGAKVYFGNDASASVTFVSATSLTAVTPMGTPGPVDVRVQNPDGQIATLSQGFVYVDGSALQPAPVVSAVAPAMGGSVDPTPVMITAQNVQMGAVVFAGGVPATAVTVGTGMVGATFPPHEPGAVDVVITNPDGQSGRLPNGFSYTRSPPSLTSITPGTVPLAGGLRLLVAGRGFVMGCGVTIDSTPVVPTFIDSTLLFVIAPPHAAGTVDVRVTNPDMQSASLPMSLTYSNISLGAAPTLTSIFPASGPSTGGTVALVVGTDLVAGAQVLFGTNRATNVTVMSATRLTAVAPAGMIGTVDLTVVNPDGQSAQLVQGFRYVDPASLGAGPQLFSVTPNSGVAQGGTQTVLTGMGFRSGMLVFFGGYTANASSVQNAGIATATTPAGPSGSVAVAVTNPDGQSSVLPGGYSYIPRPIVMTMTPQTGPTTGGTTFTLAGSNFGMGARVFFDNVEATGVNVASAFVITGSTPPHGAGAVDVRVTNADGQSGTLAGGFTFNAPPTIAAVRPGAGPLSGGSTLVVTGTGFANGATVTIGTGTATNVRVLSPTQLLVVTPSGAAGAADVRVTNTDGQAVTLARGFLFEPADQTVGRAMTYPDVVVPIARDDAQYATDLGVVNLSGRAVNVTLSAHDSAGVQVAARSLAAAVPPFGRVLVPDVLQFIESAAMTVNRTASVTIAADGPVQAFGVLKDKASNDSSVLPGSTAARASARVLVPYASSVGAFRTWLAVRNVGAAPATVDITARDPAGAQLGRLNAVSIAAGGFYSSDDVLSAMSVTGATATIEIDGTAASVLASARTYSNGRLGGLVTGRPFSEGATSGTLAWVPDTNVETSSIYVVNTSSTTSSMTTLELRSPSGQVLGSQTVTVPAGGFVQVPDLARTVLMRTQPTQTLSSVGITATQAVMAFVFSLSSQNSDLRFAQGRPGGGVHMRLPYADPRTSLFVTNVGPLPASLELSVTVDSGAQRGSLLRVTVPPKGSYQSPLLLSSLGAGTSAGVVDIRSTNGMPFVATAKVGAEATGLIGDATELGNAITTPAIDVIRPATGPSTGATMSRVTGQYFLPFAQFLYGDALAPRANVFSDDVAVVVSPPGTGNVDLTVVNFDGASSTLVNAFAYVDPSALGQPPAVSSVQPQTVSTLGGTPVQINGSNFASNALAFVGLSPVAGATQVNPSRVDGAAPGGSVGPADVTVTNPDGQSATLSGAVTYAVPPPSIATVTPNQGPGAGGNVVRIAGSGFQPGASVGFASTSAGIVTVLSSTDIDVTVPPGSDGPVAISVVNPDGQSTTLNNGYTYVAAPVVAQVQPTSGPTSGGTTITITGTFFRSGATVSVGTVPCTAVVVQPGGTQVSCLTPAGTAGPAAVRVTNPDGQSGVLNNAFTYLAPVPPPTVTAISPAFGSTNGGTQVTIIGTNFQAGAAVTFGTIASPAVTVVSPSAISATVPGSASVGAVTVTVTNPDTQTGSLPNGFTYFQPASLPGISIASVTPNEGPTGGGNTVFISGQGFLAGVTVTFGTVPSPQVTWHGPSALSAIAPPQAAALVSVTATNPTSASSTLNNAYRYSNGVLFNPPPMRLPMLAQRGYGVSALVDVDGDGDLDLFAGKRQVSCENDGADEVWLNDNASPGTFLIAGSNVLPPLPQRSTMAIVTGDFDNTGTQDVFTITDSANTTPTLWVNRGGTFARVDPALIPTIRQGEQRALAVGDLDTDGKQDVFVGVGYTTQGQPNGNVDYWYKNNGDGGFTPTRSGWLFPDGGAQTSDDTRAVCIADYDRDGDDDIFLVNGSNQQPTYYLQGPVGTFTLAQGLLPTGIGGLGTGCVAAELRPGSGIKDIVLTRDGVAPAIPYVYLTNDGMGRFTDEARVNVFRLPSPAPSSAIGVPFPVGSGGRYAGIATFDLDNDGDLDLLMSHPDLSPRLQAYINDGAGFFTLGTAGRVPPWLDAEAFFVVGDVNSDGRRDVLLMGDQLQTGTGPTQGSGWTGTVPAQHRLLLNSPGGNLQPSTMRSIPEQSYCVSDAVNVDIDGDMDEDLVMATGCRYFTVNCGQSEPAYCRENGVRIWVNDGAGGYTDATATRFPAFTWSATVVVATDFDRDGVVDLVVGTSGINPAATTTTDQYGIRLYKNNGAGVFSDVTYPRMPLQPLAVHTIAIIDADKDGAPDIFAGTDLGCSGIGRQRLYVNTGNGFFLDVTPQLPGTSSGFTPPQNTRLRTSSVADFNNDGYLDLYTAGFVGSSGNRSGLLYFNSGALNPGVFVDVTSSRAPNPNRSTYWSAAVDLNNDTYQDLFLCNGGGGVNGQDLVDTGDVNGSLSDITQTNWPGETQPQPYPTLPGCTGGPVAPVSSVSCAVGDVNADTYPDIVLAGLDQGNIYMRNRLMINGGTANFSDRTTQSMPFDNDYTTKVLIFRANADTKPDLFIGNCGQPRIYLQQ